MAIDEWNETVDPPDEMARTEPEADAQIYEEKDVAMLGLTGKDGDLEARALQEVSDLEHTFVWPPGMPKHTYVTLCRGMAKKYGFTWLKNVHPKKETREAIKHVAKDIGRAAALFLQISRSMPTANADGLGPIRWYLTRPPSSQVFPMAAVESVVAPSASAVGML